MTHKGYEEAKKKAERIAVTMVKHGRELVDCQVWEIKVLQRVMGMRFCPGHGNLSFLYPLNWETGQISHIFQA